jgi:hypothetical protein
MKNKHLREKERKKQVRQKQLQKEQQKILHERIEVAKNKDKLNISQVLQEDDVPQNIKNKLNSKNKKSFKRGLNEYAKFLARQENVFKQEAEYKIAVCQGRFEMLDELVKEIEKTPTEEDIIEAGKFLIYTQNKVFRKITPIQTYLKQKDFLLDNIDIGDVLEKSGLFRKGIFSRVWKYGKQSKLEIFIRNKTLIGFYAGKNMLQKFLMQCYKVRNNIFKSN